MVKLPSKLRPWYIYAMKFVETIRTKSPKIVVRQALPRCKIGTIMMLNGLIEVTIKARKEDNGIDVVKVVVQAPKYEVYLLQ